MGPTIVVVCETCFVNCLVNLMVSFAMQLEWRVIAS